MIQNKAYEKFMNYKHQPLKIGDRVGCVYTVTELGRVKFFGYGIYKGYQNNTCNFVFPKNTKEFFMLTKGIKDDLESCVELDNGSLVWSREAVFIPENIVSDILKESSDILIVLPKSGYSPLSKEYEIIK